MTDTAIQAFAQGIAHAEGFYKPGTLPNRANNPGDLSAAVHWHGQIGSIHSSGVGATEIAVFDTAENGWTALRTNLTNHIKSHPNQMLKDYLQAYCQATGTALQNYIATVIHIMGFGTPDSPLVNIGNGQH